MKKDGHIEKGSQKLRIGNNVFARFLRNDKGRIELAIIVNDATSAEDLRSGWGAIDKLRQHLREFQGSDMNTFNNALIYNYHQMKVNGWSYNLIAMDINYDCLVNLCRASEEILNTQQTPIVSSGLSDAFFLLRVMRMKDEDILAWLIPSIDEIKNGNAPWSVDRGPIDGQRVRDTIRQWEREQESKKVIVRQPPKGKPRAISEIVQTNKKYNQQARELLTKSDFASFDKYEKMVARVIAKSGYIGAVHVVK